MSARIVTRVSYEWDYEETDEHGDIVDHRHVDKCNGLPTEQNVTLVLVRDEAEGWSDDFDNSAEMYHRSWAYVRDGILPDTFEDGYPVPKRLRAEFDRSVR